MPAKNLHHDGVRRALVADGWTITDDPLTLSYGGRDLFVDLGAERTTLAAEKADRRIAVEIQSFVSQSAIRDLEVAVGQYEVYRVVLSATQPDRSLYLAIPLRVQENLLGEKFGKLVIERLGLHLVVFDEVQDRITQWIEPSSTA